MKKILLGAVAAAAVAAPSIASADTNAVVGVHYANTDYDSFDFDAYGLDGAFSYDLSNGHVLQMDGRWDRIDTGSGCCLGSSYGAVHYGMRNDSHAFAGWVGLTDYFIYSGLGLGIEGQMYLGNFNLNGSLGYVDFDDVGLDDVTAQVDGAYFFTPNLALTGLVSYSEADFGGGGDVDWTTLGIGGEYRFAGTAFSVTGGYRNHDFDGGDADTWMIGFNMDLGTDSVQERTRTGAGFNGASALFGALGSITP